MNRVDDYFDQKIREYTETLLKCVETGASIEQINYHAGALREFRIGKQLAAGDTSSMLFMCFNERLETAKQSHHNLCWYREHYHTQEEKNKKNRLEGRTNALKDMLDKLR